MYAAMTLLNDGKYRLESGGLHKDTHGAASLAAVSYSLMFCGDG